MFIGKRYNDKKLYRGLKYYDKLPLLSEDLHESTDIEYRKHALFSNNIVGEGVINKFTCSLDSSSNLSLDQPAIVLIDGDISIVQSSTSKFIERSELVSAGYENGLVCIVGWYQLLLASSTLREYGGVRNTILPNDLIDNPLAIQVSTRYQLRWDIIVLNKQTYDSGSAMTISLKDRDDKGNPLSTTSTVTIPASSKTVRIAPKPTRMDYAVSDLYIVPIASYQYKNGTISNPTAPTPASPKNEVISSTTQPTGTYESGTIWYNPNTATIKFYVAGVGFISASTDLSLVQYTNTVILTSEIIGTNPNIDVSIGISAYAAGDVLQVIYDGVVLTSSSYTVNTETKKVTLLALSPSVGDAVTFFVTKLVGSNGASDIVSELTTHLSAGGDSSTKGHVSLSDSASSSLGATSNVAATPKAVYDATTLVDTATGKKYRLKVTNGTLGITQI